MKANYHTHTFRCRHATGTEEEYIKIAIAKGLTTLGFSDHTVYALPEDMPYPHGRMTPEETKDYFDVLLALKEKYRDYIDIKIGFETEYFPMYWDELIELYKKYPTEYLILGQHEVGKNPINKLCSSFTPTENPKKLRLYADQCIEGMRTGMFTYIAHPDVFYFTGGRELYEQEMARIIAEANKFGLPLEFNLQGMRSGKWYPNDVFWRLAAKMGAKSVIGCDAHSPNAMADENELEEAKRRLDGYGIEILDELELLPVNR